jgi:regulatory protein
MKDRDDDKIEKRKKRTPRKVTPKYLDNAALYYLSRYATSAENLKRVMMRKINRSAKHHGTEVEDGAALLEAMIARYLDSGLLDDGAYAKTRAASLHRRGNSARVITGKLRQKGVGNDDIDAALHALGEEDPDPELAAAVMLAKRRRLGPFATKEPTRGEDGPRARGGVPRSPQGPDRETIKDTREKHLAALARAGFSYDIARRVIDADSEDDLEHPS